MGSDRRLGPDSQEKTRVQARVATSWPRQTWIVSSLALAVVGVLLAAILVWARGQESGGGNLFDRGRGAGGQPGSQSRADTARDGATSQRLFQDRPDRRQDDVERQVGQPADVSGYTARITLARFQRELTTFERNGYVVANVTLQNDDDQVRTYGPSDWKLLPAGNVIQPAFGSIRQLGSGELAEGAMVSGQIVWEVGSQRGDFYIVFEPPGAGDARGVWKVTAS